MLKSRALKFISVFAVSGFAVLGVASASFADSSYTVKSGDTLSGVAASHGTTWEKLQSVNHLANPNLVLPGEVITLPGGSEAQSSPIIDVGQPPVPASSVDWNAVAVCESTSNWAADTGNGFYGGLQFTESTWLAYGGGQYAQYANDASQSAQETVANAVLASQGIGAWPVCGSLG